MTLILTLTVILILLQLYTGMGHVLRATIAQEGVRGLYKARTRVGLYKARTRVGLYKARTRVGLYKARTRVRLYKARSRMGSEGIGLRG